jgi:hypothetical protein
MEDQDFNLISITFNYDPNSANHDALNIRTNAAGFVAPPEWKTVERSPVAYSIADTQGQTIRIKVQFKSDTDEDLHVFIRALGSGVLGHVKQKKVLFKKGIHTSNVMFDLQHVTLGIDGVGEYPVTWAWQYSFNGHHWHNFLHTHHTVYALLAMPTAPWVQQPFNSGNTQLVWTDVLKYACKWASGATDPVTAESKITAAVYALGPVTMVYDCPGGGFSHYSFAGFNCTAFLDLLSGGPGLGKFVNCSDCATFVSTFANAIGCDLWQSRMGSGFRLNPILAIGSNVWQTACGWGSFSYHEVAWKNQCGVNDEVFDACLEVNGNPNPLGPPFAPLLPTNIKFGAVGTLLYRDRLCNVAGRPNCNPQPQTRQRRAVM